VCLADVLNVPGTIAVDPDSVPDVEAVRVSGQDLVSCHDGGQVSRMIDYGRGLHGLGSTGRRRQV